MNNAKNAKKRERFTGVQKRSTYNEMKESNNKAKTFAVMLKNNPKILDYFTKKNVITRIPEFAKIIVWTEQYARKEHTRSPLYFIVEKYKKDKKFKHPSAQKEIKKLIQDTITYCKSTDSNEYGAVLKVLENINKKEIDTDKIFRDKEWYRPLIRTIGAMGLGAYLAASAFWAVPETKPEPVIEQVKIEDDTCEKSLDLCLGALNGLNESPTIVTRKVEVTKMPDKNEYCGEYIGSLQALKAASAEGEKAFLDEIDRLNNRIVQLMKINPNQNIKIILLEKLDNKFKALDEESYNTVYPKYRKIWEERLKSNDFAAFKTLIDLGDYILEYLKVDDRVIGAYGDGEKMANGKIANIRRAMDPRDFTRKFIYASGNHRDNKIPGVGASYIDFIERTKYGPFKRIYGDKKFNKNLKVE